MSFQGRFKTKGLDSIRLEGEVVGDYKVHAYGADGHALLASGTTVPTDTTSGFAKGCLFIDTDVGAGSSGIYENVGTSTSCNFDQIGANTTLAAGGVDTDQLAADAVTGAKIEDDAVSLEHLDAGVTPSHVVKFAGEASWSGGGTSLAETVTGVEATDIVIASIETVPSEAAYLVSAAATADTLTFTLSAANSTNDAVISYMVLRAAA